MHATTLAPSVRVLHPAAFIVLLSATGAPAQIETVRVQLTLRTGGVIDGLVVEHCDDGLVIAHDRTPYVFSWQALEPGSALEAKRKLLALKRGGEDALEAADFFELGSLALTIGRPETSAGLFRQASKLDAGFGPRAAESMAKHHARVAARTDATVPYSDEVEAGNSVGDDSETNVEFGLGALVPVETAAPAVRKQVDGIYRIFGEKVREVMGEDIALIETEHFLIWTDWKKRHHTMLAETSESMYRALCTQFGLDPNENIFLAKCPVFCWRSKQRFVKFARFFDGHEGSNAVGYTRSIERNGHVHVVLLRHGTTQIDFDRFASTLVHEGTHAFLHRLYAPRLIPHWVNEGLAELTAERILGERGVAAEEAAMLARVYVRYDWPLGDLLASAAPIGVEQYGLACSVVTYLDHRGSDRLASMIRSLKDGESIPDALAHAYSGLTTAQLEADWRQWVREHDPVLNPPDTEDSRLPWRRR